MDKMLVNFKLTHLRNRCNIKHVNCTLSAIEERNTIMNETRDIIVDLDKSSLFVPFHISLMENEEFTTTEKMLYLALKSFAINCSACYPSNAKIMKRSGIKSTSTLSTTMKSLEKKGVVLVIPEFDSNNRRKTNTYYLARYDHELEAFDASSFAVLEKKKRIADEQAKHLKQGMSKGRSKC